MDIHKRLNDFSLDVSFEAERGVFGLLGASGCGKSYTLKCIAGIEKPDSGKIVLDGVTLFDSERKIDLPPQKRKVGYLFQNYALFPNMTVRQNILCGLRSEKDRKKREDELERVLSLFQIEDLINHKPHQISGGQAQRVALARIMVSKPNVLLLDEPFSALDAHLKEKLQLEMKGILENFGKSVIMVTHSRDEAYHMCARIAAMDGGSICRLDETKRLFADPYSVAAAQITGCKNITAAYKVGDYEIDAPEWGVRLTSAQPVRDDIKAVGLRAHYFNVKSHQNSFPIEITGKMEEPFEVIVEFRYLNQREDSPNLWWRIPKDRLPNPYPNELGIAPVNVNLLYG